MNNIDNFKQWLKCWNDNRVVKELKIKKTLNKVSYIALKNSEIQFIKNNDKDELLKKLYLYIDKKDNIWNINNLFNDYDIEKKREPPQKILNSDDIVKVVEWLKFEKQEHLVLITLDGNNNIINNRLITKWLLNQSLIHPREVFAPAIEDRANSFIIVHNHPSGTLNPSIEDIISTDKLKQTSKIIWIKLLDHVIISRSWYYSFDYNNLL